MAKTFKIILDLATFSAGDVERITGVGATLQREWRRRGFLPETAPGQKARFNIFTIAELLVMQRLAEHGVGPSASIRAADLWGSMIAENALQSPLAYGGQFSAFQSVPLKTLNFDHSREWQHTDRGAIAEDKTFWLIEGLPVEMGEATDPQIAAYFAEWRDTIDTPYGRAGWLAHRVLPMKGGLMYLGPHRYMVWWSGDRFERALSLDKVFDTEAEKSIHGADSAFVLDARSLARTLLHRAGKPLVSITIEEGNVP